MDEFTEVSNESWFGRIGGAIKGVIVGLILFVIAFPVLFWNEGRAVKTYKALKEGEGAVVSVSSDSVDNANDGKLVHMSGEATTEDTVKDSEFGVSAKALKLIRDVETYQWKETKRTRTRKKLGGGKRKETTYSYNKVWSKKLIDSSRFRKQAGHSNPASVKFRNDVFLAGDVQIGAFKLSKSLLRKISKSEALRVDGTTLPASVKNSVKPFQNGYYAGTTPTTPTIGDQKINFRVVNPQVISLIAKQVGDTFEPYQTTVGESLELLETGTKTSKQMFQTAIAKNQTLTWIIRLVGFVLMVIGISLVLRPLSVLADVIPFLGSLVGIGTFIIAFLISLFFSLITIAVAWIFYRPLLGISLIVLALIFGAFIFIFRKKNANA